MSPEASSRGRRPGASPHAGCARLSGRLEASGLVVLMVTRTVTGVKNVVGQAPGRALSLWGHTESLQQPFEVNTAVITPILQMRKLRLGEINWLVHSYRV